MTAPVTITALPAGARFSLRTGDPATVGAGLGLELPARVGQRAVAGARAALCLGPDEWLVEAPEGEGAAIADAFAGLVERLTFSAVEVSDREVGFALAGPAVLDLIATGCPRDPAKLPVGSGCRTIFDSVQVVLTREAQDCFHLTVWRSFAPHLRALLDIAARELAAGL
ncbi:sarcosine oxidase subunit gamma [Bosea sp. (in: a-proteobacteria)]|uniref:sarcosine oxidase subunit gamma n=1 Tax=Bosea sp. (in: a-proteobacteria) TaxID=1871050 RepID=UPI0026090D68|nr:sarcosine oxidase subunit gamma family protein [Bosea sp. (in: a-proteobacteria)]MCO5089857.1 sarcosine oxidase subunit gamma [Bosea sp. (in: a-proteobacteria)]